MHKCWCSDVGGSLRHPNMRICVQSEPRPLLILLKRPTGRPTCWLQLSCALHVVFRRPCQ